MVRGFFFIYYMNIQDDSGKLICVGDNVVLWDGRKCCRAVIRKETATSIGYQVYGWHVDYLLDKIYWMRKSGNPVKGMVKL